MVDFLLQGLLFLNSYLKKMRCLKENQSQNSYTKKTAYAKTFGFVSIHRDKMVLEDIQKK